MRLPQTDTEFRNALVDAAEVGSMKTLIELDILKPDMSFREACRKYGPAIVPRWIKEGLIRPRKDGNNTSKLRIDRLEIDAVSKASNRSSYLTTEERQK